MVTYRDITEGTGGPQTPSFVQHIFPECQWCELRSVEAEAETDIDSLLFRGRKQDCADLISAQRSLGHREPGPLEKIWPIKSSCIGLK